MEKVKNFSKKKKKTIKFFPLNIKVRGMQTRIQKIKDLSQIFFIYSLRGMQ